MDSKQAYQLEHENIPKLLMHYTIPAVVGTMVNALYNIVDRIFIGQGVGEFAISGLALTFPILIFLQAFGMLIGAGASARVSILLGQHDRDGAERILGNAIVLTIITQVLTIIPCLVFMEPLLRLFGASERTLPYAYDYLKYIIPANIFASLSFGYNAIMRASGYPRKAMITMLIGAVTNTLLDALFIFVFKWGIDGAAIATVISMFISAVYVMSHFFSKSSIIRFRRSNLRLSWEQICAIISIGVAPFSIQLLGSAVNIIINRSFVAYAGSEVMADRAIGAYGIVNSYVTLIVMIILGVAQGMQPVVGYNYGAMQIKRVIKAFKICAIVNVSVSTLGMILALLIPYFLSNMFTTSVMMTEVSGNAMRLCLWGFFCVGFQITSTQFFQSTGYAGKAMVLSLSRQVIFLIPLILILPKMWQLEGVWLSMPISDVLSGVMAIVMITAQLKYLNSFPDASDLREEELMKEGI